MLFMKKSLLATISLFALVVSLGAVGVARTARAATIVPVAQIQPGTLFRGQNFSAVYYMGKDGFRYVFPTDRVYFSWYKDFNTVKWISDADLTTLQIGGNVTYKPGSRMVKISSDPKTYAVDQGGKLRWVTSEAVAIASYGPNWNKQIDDIADGFFSNYKMGADIETPEDYVTAEVLADTSSIDEDKGLKAPTYITLTDAGFSPSSVTIKAGTAVRWTNTGTADHTATADDLQWGTGTLKTGQNFSRYFKTAGTYTYKDSYNPSLTATIIVE